MRLLSALGLVLGVSVAMACSSNGTSSLGGQTGGGGSGGSTTCGAMGKAASDGQGYVQKEGCANCHGTNMAGRLTPLVAGEDGVTLKQGDILFPPNLTPDQKTGIGNWTDEQINQAITEGVDNNGMDLCPEMGRHYPNMCADEVTGIIAYLRSLPAVAQSVPGSYCPPLKTTKPDGG